MSIPLFAYLYCLMGILSLAVAIIIYRSYRREKNSTLLSLILVFLFLFVRGMAISIPAFVNAQDDRALALGGIIAVVAVYGLVLAGVRLQMFLEHPFFRKHSRGITGLLAVLGIASVSLLVYDFRLPIITESGLILWNANPIATWVTGGLSLVYGIFWCAFLNREARYVEDPWQKMKMYMLSLDGIFVGTAFFLTFTAEVALQAAVGLGLLLISIFLTLAVFSLAQRGLPSTF